MRASRTAFGAHTGVTRSLASALLAAFTVAGAPAFAQASAPAAPTASATSAQALSSDGAHGLVLATCRLHGLEHDALCGVLRRPLDPARPAGRTIDVHVAVIPALARQKHPDPVFFFAGGPGQSAIDLAGNIDHLVGRLGARRDIVLVDQRGTGLSAPLGCDSPAADEAVEQAFDRSKVVAAMDRCRQALEKRPYGDLRQFTTTIAMGDVDAVRAALGAATIDLVGVSYGTRAALEYMRLYPSHVRRVVLDAVAAPDMVLPASMGTDISASLDAMFRGCAADTACASAHPELAHRWQALLASLPRTFTAADPSSGLPRTFTLTRDAATSLVRPGLYVPSMGAALPFAIEQAIAGRLEPLLAVAGSMGGAGGLDLFEGMHFSVVCAEDAPRLPPPAATDDGNVTLYREVCAHWPRGEVPEGFYTVPASPAPVLLLSGSADPVTPPRHAERIAKSLGSRARHVIVPNGGHGQLSLACVRDAAVRFIDTAADDDAAKIDFGCVGSIPRARPFAPPLPRRATSAPTDGPVAASLGPAPLSGKPAR